MNFENFDELVSSIRRTVKASGLTVSPVAFSYLDRDWGVPPNTRSDAIAELTEVVLTGAPEACRQFDRVKFSSPTAVAFVALSEPQPHSLEAILVRPVKARV